MPGGIRTFNPWGHVSNAERARRMNIMRDLRDSNKKQLSEESTTLQRITNFHQRPNLIKLVRILQTCTDQERDPSELENQQINALMNEVLQNGIWNQDIEFVLLYDIERLKQEVIKGGGEGG
jgi:hypothetical protein